MREVYGTLTRQNPSFLWDMFHVDENSCNLRSRNWMLPQTKTSTYGIDSLSSRGSILWNSMPNSIKIATSLCSFKLYIRNWNRENWLCNIGKYDILILGVTMYEP